jgi:hypothetical protein
MSRHKAPISELSPSDAQDRMRTFDRKKGAPPMAIHERHASFIDGVEAELIEKHTKAITVGASARSYDDGKGLALFIHRPITVSDAIGDLLCHYSTRMAQLFLLRHFYRAIEGQAHFDHGIPKRPFYELVIPEKYRMDVSFNTFGRILKSCCVYPLDGTIRKRSGGIDPVTGRNKMHNIASIYKIQHPKDVYLSLIYTMAFWYPWLTVQNMLSLSRRKEYEPQPEDFWSWLNDLQQAEKVEDVLEFIFVPSDFPE